METLLPESLQHEGDSTINEHFYFPLVTIRASLRKEWDSSLSEENLNRPELSLTRILPTNQTDSSLPSAPEKGETYKKTSIESHLHLLVRP